MQTITIIPAAMTALETAIAATEAAQKESQQTAPWASRTAQEIEPTKWTRDIEAALSKPDELNSLRVRFDEKTLTFVSAWLTHSIARSRVFDCFTPLCDGIRDVIAFHDETSGLDPRLKSAMQSLVLRGSEVHRRPHADDGQDGYRGIGARAYTILVEAFSKLAVDLQKIHVLTSEERRQGYRPVRYTIDLVVNGRAHQSFLNPDVDLRGVFKVAFVDCVNSQHPHGVKLVEAIIAVEEAVNAARSAVKKLKADQNGSINEKQHAGRMLDLLHGAPQGCGGNISDQVKAQNQRRRAYESARLELLMVTAALQARYDELVECLVLAGAETAAFLQEVQAERHITVDRELTIRIAMNNCLAADLYLRRVGREIAELNGNEARDLSLGNGAAALAADYEEVAKQYRPFKRAEAPAASE